MANIKPFEAILYDVYKLGIHVFCDDFRTDNEVRLFVSMVEVLKAAAMTRLSDRQTSHPSHPGEE